MTSPRTPTLDEVAAAFHSWRIHKPKGNPAIPEPLKQQAVALLPHYPMGQLLTALRLNHQPISRWKRQAVEPHRPVTPAFVTLEPLREDEALTLTWSTQTAQGIPLSVAGTLPPEQWRTVLTLLNRMGG